MAVAFDAVGPSSAGTSASFANALSWSHTCSGSNRILIVGITVGYFFSNSNTDTVTVTYNSVAMTSLGRVKSANQNNGYVEMFALFAPATGANTVAVSVSSIATPTTIVGGSVSFTGASQSNPTTIATSYGTSGASVSSISAGVATASTGMVVDAVCTGTSVTSSTQTNRWLDNAASNSGAGNGAMSTAAGTGSTVTMGYSVSSDWSAIIAAFIPQAGAGTSVTVNAVPATATAGSTGPAVSYGAKVTATRAQATAAVTAPAISVRQTVTVPAAVASAHTSAPAVSGQFALTIIAHTVVS